MLKKLRLKFMLVMMAIVTIMLGIIFGMLYFSTRRNLERESIQMMRSIAMTPGLMNLHDNQMPENREEAVRLPYFTIQVNRDGEAEDIRGGFFDLSDEELIDTLLQMTYETHDEVGILKQYGLRFLRFANRKGETIVFADMSAERSILRNQIKTLVVVGMIAFLVFGGICILLARWVVKPVEKAWKQQKQFIADASHELKTPLTVIMTDAEILKDPVCPEKEKAQILGSIITMSEQMSGLVESMLELARIDNGTIHKNKELLSLSDIMSNASMIFEPVLFERGLLFCYKIEPDIMIQGNKEQLKQLADILLDNAGKYTLPGGNVILHLQKIQHKHCLLTVSSQGDEISSEDRKHLFDRFYRADKARTRNQSYGLGLSIAQSIVKEHRGKIWVESADGYNTFYVEL